MYQLTCAECNVPGFSSADPLEVKNLTELHNSFVHRRAPVAMVQRVSRFARRRLTTGQAA